ncbi:hypothetical protein KIN20_018192 [Parelaphostrongylus tenuis]|uniref:Reverse transcriptase domain-containing protein n=1 Tax=Parelaphostrongylus tenuis TaxID=148309 RepID=A0AAD5N3Z1_PARTN|nr:hypothetical protein KIN20_018192 [Parelaphostrongylus tenuis]
MHLPHQIAVPASQSLRHIPAHLTSTQMFLNRLRNASPNDAYVMESFDVTAFYANVSNEFAMQGICQPLTEREGTEHVWLPHPAGNGSLERMPKLFNLQMVGELFCPNQRASNGTTTIANTCYSLYA